MLAGEREVGHELCKVKLMEEYLLFFVILV